MSLFPAYLHCLRFSFDEKYYHLGELIEAIILCSLLVLIERVGTDAQPQIRPIACHGTCIAFVVLTLDAMMAAAYINYNHDSLIFTLAAAQASRCLVPCSEVGAGIVLRVVRCRTRLRPYQPPSVCQVRGGNRVMYR